MTLAVFVAIAIGLGALLARGLFLGYPPAVLHPSMFSRKEQAIIAACADALFPPKGPIPLSGTDAGLVEYMDHHVGDLAPDKRALVKLLFLFVEHGPWVFGPRRARFTRLSQADRVVVLKQMSESSIYFRRIAFLSIRTMLTMGYLANADVARRLGIKSEEAPFAKRPASVPPPPSTRPPSLGTRP